MKGYRFVLGNSGGVKLSDGYSSNAQIDNLDIVTTSTGSTSGSNKSTCSEKSEKDDYVMVSLVSELFIIYKIEFNE